MVKLKREERVKKANGTKLYPDPIFNALFFCERVFSQTTDRAFPIIRNLFPRCAGSYPIVGVSNGRIIHVSARASILIHNICLLL